MRSRFKQLGKDSLIYGLGGVFARGIGFFFLPIYTRIFNPADYGVLEMLGALGGILGAIIVMGMDAAQSFYFFEQKGQGQQAQARVVTAILQWQILWGILVVILALALSLPINHLFFGGRLSAKYFFIVFWGVFAVQIMNQSAEVFRLLYRPIGYLSITLGQTLLSVTASLVLILVFNLGIYGFVWGTLIGGLVGACFGWWRIRDYLDWSIWHLEWWPRLIRFGAPLLPAALAMYVLSTVDRWFVSHYSGQEALGLYAVGAKFALLITMAVNTFRQAWAPVAMDAMHSEDGPALFRAVGRLYLGCGSAGIVVITALSPYLVRWFTAPAYSSAYPIVGVLSWCSLFFGTFLIFSAGIAKTERMIWMPVLMGCAALLNVVLSIYLVPRYGGMGAAVATLISFGVWNLMAIIVSERLWPVQYHYTAMTLQVVIGICSCSLIILLYRMKVDNWFIWPFTIGMVIILLFLSLTREHLRKILSATIIKLRSATG